MNNDPPLEPEVIREHSFTSDGPVELDLGVGAGRIEVRLSEPGTSGNEPAVRVQLKHDPGAASKWTQGWASTLNWVMDQFGEQIPADLRGSANEAVGQAGVEMIGDRLVVRTGKALPLRHIPLALTVHAPDGSRVESRGGSTSITVTGTAGAANVHTGAGDVALERVAGPVTVRSGGGAISLGTATGEVRLRSGGGEIRMAEASGTLSVVTGTGSVRLGAVDGEVLVRSGSGDITVADAGSGTIELGTGSGDVRVGIRSGTRAEIELSAAGGEVASELEVADTPPEGEVALRLRAKTGSGRVMIGRAAN